MNVPSKEKPFLVVSDLHLGGVPGDTERRFRAFLDYVARESSGLLINGDLFEFGIAYRWTPSAVISGTSLMLPS